MGVLLMCFRPQKQLLLAASGWHRSARIILENGRVPMVDSAELKKKKFKQKSVNIVGEYIQYADSYNVKHSKKFQRFVFICAVNCYNYK